MVEQLKCESCGAVIRRYRAWEKLWHKILRKDLVISGTKSTTTVERPHSYDYVIPVYLDTNAVFDLWALISDGFSMIEKVTCKSITAEKSQTSEGGEFNVNPSIFKIGVKGSKDKESSLSQEMERSLERSQTPESLFNKLRSQLVTMGLLNSYLSAQNLAKFYKSVRPFEFVELRGLFRPNPLVETISFINMMRRAGDASYGVASPATDEKVTTHNLNDSPNVVKKSLEIFPELEQGDARLFVVDLLNNFDKASDGYYAIVSLFTKYARDTTMSELSHRKFRVLGKVAQNIPESRQINPAELLRGTRFDSYGKTLNECLNQNIDDFTKGFTSELLRKKFQTDLLNQTTTMTAVLEIIPIAIYI
jgi:hypothetical protein